MKPNEILQASVLDILFENRNKNYGAYPLRKYYPQRIKKSIFIAFFIMGGLMFVLSSFKTKGNALVLNNKSKEDRVLSDANKKKEETPKEKPPKEEVKEPKKGVDNSSARVDVVVSTPVFTKDPTEVITGNFGKFLNPNGKVGEEENPGVEKGTETGTKIDTTTKVITTITKPIVDETKPSYEASYVGGRTALGEYLQEYLEDEAIDDGENKKVVIRYCIETDGTITNITADDNGDKDFMQRAVKVFEKMKKWKPAVQFGEPIRSCKVMPITIVLPE